MPEYPIPSEQGHRAVAFPVDVSWLSPVQNTSIGLNQTSVALPLLMWVTLLTRGAITVLNKDLALAGDIKLPRVH